MIKIGTRGSALALAQANYVKSKLEVILQETIEIIVIKTIGDQILDRPIEQINDKGVFVKEIEQQLLDGQIDIAVHSMKDMPTEEVENLTFCAIPKREDARDALILSPDAMLKQDQTIRIGTGSLRRKVQLRELYENFQTVGIRGNINTRLKRVEDHMVDGVVLAMAGLRRLGYTNKVSRVFSIEEMVPAACQGILAVQSRVDHPLLEEFQKLTDPIAELQCRTERAFLREVGGGCHAPVGCYCRIDEQELSVLGMIETEGEMIRKSIRGSRQEPEETGRKLAKWMKKEISACQ